MVHCSCDDACAWTYLPSANPAQKAEKNEILQFMVTSYYKWLFPEGAPLTSFCRCLGCVHFSSKNHREPAQVETKLKEHQNKIKFCRLQVGPLAAKGGFCACAWLECRGWDEVPRFGYPLGFPKAHVMKASRMTWVLNMTTSA